jgi:hypothetical protein
MAQTGPRGAAGRGDNLVIDALLRGQTYRQAAVHGGVSERTVKRRMADPGFRRRLQEAAVEAEKSLRRRVTASAEAGVMKLVQILGDPTKADQHERVARTLVQAFTALQPKELRQDIELHEVPIIDYVVEGIDPELLR